MSLKKEFYDPSYKEAVIEIKQELVEDIKPLQKSDEHSSESCLHTLANENSINGQNELNSVEDGEAVRIEKSKFGKTWKGSKSVFSGSSSKNTFEIPRQESEGTSSSELREIVDVEEYQGMLDPNMCAPFPMIPPFNPKVFPPFPKIFPFPSFGMPPPLPLIDVGIRFQIQQQELLNQTMRLQTINQLNLLVDRVLHQAQQREIPIRPNVQRYASRTQQRLNKKLYRKSQVNQNDGNNPYGYDAFGGGRDDDRGSVHRGFKGSFNDDFGSHGGRFGRKHEHQPRESFYDEHPEFDESQQLIPIRSNVKRYTSRAQQRLNKKFFKKSRVEQGYDIFDGGRGHGRGSFHRGFNGGRSIFGDFDGRGGGYGRERGHQARENFYDDEFEEYDERYSRGRRGEHQSRSPSPFQSPRSSLGGYWESRYDYSDDEDRDGIQV